jgi:tripartite-type tricarboxylate transporter receptor subunit TctC
VSARPSRRRALAALAGLGALALRPAPARADERWPSRPLRLIVGAAAGAADATPRAFAAELAEALGQPVIVENRPGASANIASELVARAAPDGYTLLWARSEITLTPTILGRTVVVDPVTAFAPITKVLTTSVIVYAHRTLGVSTLHELLSLAKVRPGGLSYGLTGLGTLPHLVMETLARRAGAPMTAVPYSNFGQAVANFASGEVPVMPSFHIAMQALTEAGTVRPLAVAAARRASYLPDVPTVAELGFPEATVEPWAGFMAPAGTPAPIIQRLHAELVRIAQSPGMREQYRKSAMDSVISTPEAFADEIRQQTARWPAIVKAAGVATPN